jgi:hypothetical protein
LLSPPLLLEIDEGTPAAEALKANADVRVSKLRKVGRSTKLQAGVRALKSGRHTGDRRGAPAFVAPRGREDSRGALASTSGMPPPTIPEADDEEGDADDRDGEGASGADESDYSADGRSAVDHDDSSSLDYPPDRPGHDLDDSRNDRSRQSQPFSGAPPVHGSPQVQQRKSVQFVSHAALPAAVAAACFAGEELDRRRGEDAAAGPTAAHKSPMKSPFAGLFKSLAPAASSNAEGDVDNALQFQKSGGGHRLSNSISEGMRMHRRATSAVVIPPENIHNFIPQRRHSSFSASSQQREALLSNDALHHMPSEISVADTVKHGNLRLDDDDDSRHSSISDDGEVHTTADAHIDPIIVNIPGSRRNVTHEEMKEEDGVDEDADHQKALRAKAKKKLIRSSEEGFSFAGPKSVRKWVKRHKSQEKSKSTRSYVKGKVIDGKHELYTMSIAVMFGMRTSIGRTNLAMSKTAHNQRRWLDNDDLMAVEKYEFPPRVSAPEPFCFTTFIHLYQTNNVTFLPEIEGK